MPDLGDVPGDVALALYRIVQESLANIHRHSGSRSATIRLSRQSGEIVLTVADRGRGIPRGVLERSLGKHRSESTPGVGITGMKERVRELGGRLEIQSGIQGTTVTVVLPLRQEARSAGSSG
jgi:signal transduction histidine kinase